mmetsp:Transcript_7430/g.11805  ORF Transcript_7430/g.11805 Transcript_7430/m.11805 type:complete len:158 (-) Transcript_7430:338-811(-)|eukprot:CAMPEP_0184671158 /NCGR_PEP_ID=MMETSP0308-20130426/85336_1 /TAXON_ID=38269 /ORGANISM="Gloeochaete witrockiana, Strain SAG 46.84" /LENGTH=157 /DNA_ID=CAMNT_0027118237 /DNA_START=270 /DNA_END=743 /DNA_ORIENTATION=+
MSPMNFVVVPPLCASSARGALASSSSVSSRLPLRGVSKLNSRQTSRRFTPSIAMSAAPDGGMWDCVNASSDADYPAEAYEWTLHAMAFMKKSAEEEHSEDNVTIVECYKTYKEGEDMPAQTYEWILEKNRDRLTEGLQLDMSPSPTKQAVSSESVTL